MKFRISEIEPWKIYEDTGDVKKDRLVMWATPSGALFVGPGLGDEEEELYEGVPEELYEQALSYWREKEK